MPKFLLLQNIPDGVSFGLNTINHATLLSLSSVLPLSRPLASPSSYRMLLFFLSLQTLQRTPKRQNNDNCRHGSHSNCSVMRSKGNELPPTSGSALGYQRAMDFSSWGPSSARRSAFLYSALASDVRKHASELSFP